MWIVRVTRFPCRFARYKIEVCFLPKQIGIEHWSLHRSRRHATGLQQDYSFHSFSNARENLPCFTEAVCSACLKLLFWEKTCLGHICSLPHEGLTIICGKSLAWSHFRCWGKLRTRSNCEHNSSTQAFFLSICLQRVNKMQSSLHYLHLARAKVSYFRIASWRSHHFLMG